MSPIHFNSPNLIVEEQTASRQRAEEWQDEQTKAGNEFPYLALDKECESCIYVCKRRWRFAGIEMNGSVMTVGPTCPVLWHFSPYNPLRR